MPPTSYDEIPGTTGWPLVGNIPHFTREPLAFLENLRHEHGPIARFRMARLPYVQLADPEGIRQVLVTKNHAFTKHKYLRWTLGDALGDGLLVAEDDNWKNRRTTAQPNFRPQRIREYAPSMLQQTQRITHEWTKEPTRDIHQDMTLLTLRIAAQTLFDVDVDDDAQTIGEGLDATMQRFRSDNRLFMLLPKTVPLPMNRRYQQGKKRLHRVIEHHIQQRANDPQGDDLMSRLIRAYDAHETLDHDDLRDELATFLAAGHETTALALTWTLWLLATHPTHQTRLAQALHDAYQDEPTTLEPLDEVPLLDATINESMRLLPPVWAIGREARQGITIQGHHLPQGTQILMPQWVVHRDPDHWENPHAFATDRWLDERQDTRHDFAHFPFGAGPRRCIGDTFAMIETRLCLAHILRHHTLTTPHEERPPLEASITLRPADPIRIHAQPRKETTRTPPAPSST